MCDETENLHRQMRSNSLAETVHSPLAYFSPPGGRTALFSHGFFASCTTDQAKEGLIVVQCSVTPNFLSVDQFLSQFHPLKKQNRKKSDYLWEVTNISLLLLLCEQSFLQMWLGRVNINSFFFRFIIILFLSLFYFKEKHKLQKCTYCIYLAVPNYVCLTDPNFTNAASLWP